MANEDTNLNQSENTDSITETGSPAVKTKSDSGLEVPEVTFKTQADFSKRLERQAKSARAELLKELGVESVEALKAKLTNDQQVSAGAGELEAIKAELARVSAYAAKAEEEKEALKNERRSQALLDALRGAVKALHLKDTVAEDLLGWATITRRDTSKLLKVDLTPDNEVLEALIKEARTERPDWFKTTRIGSPSISGLPPTELDRKQLEAAANAQWKAVKR